MPAPRILSALLRLGLGMAMGVGAQLAAVGDESRPDTPFACLFDTGSVSSQPLSGRAISAGTGWTTLAEDELAHRFAGDVVLRNNRLTVVLRRKGSGAEVYSQTPQGPRRRMVLLGLPAAGRSATGLLAVKTLENNPGAVMVEAAFETDAGRNAPLRLRLTAGQQILEIRPGEGAERLVVWDRPRYLVVPDFFADDMVFGPEAFDRSRHGLPSEHFLLHLLDGGNAMVMCVWESGQRRADALLFEAVRGRELGGCEIQCARQQPVWIACLEGPDLWHHCELPPTPETRDVILDWRPPFTARWRASFSGKKGIAESCDFGHGGQVAGPCRLERGRAVVRVSAAVAPPGGAAPPISLVVYPIDRDRTTPLTMFTPTDVVRNTLGVGPCQYILQTEGLAAEFNPTPDQVMDWIEKQLRRKRDNESARQVRDLLQQMTNHVRNVQARIDRYAEFARDVQTLCAAEPADELPGETPAALGRMAQDLERIARASRGQGNPATRAAELAAAVVDLMGKDHALAACQRVGASLRRLGAVQDRTLSKCRMMVRWLKQKARMQALAAPGGAEPSRRVWAQAERILQTK